MLSIRWIIAGRTLLDLTIGGTDEPEPEALHTMPTAGYVGEDTGQAFITAYQHGRPVQVGYVAP